MKNTEKLLGLINIPLKALVFLIKAINTFCNRKPTGRPPADDDWTRVKNGKIQ